MEDGKAKLEKEDGKILRSSPDQLSDARPPIHRRGIGSAGRFVFSGLPFAGPAAAGPSFLASMIAARSWE